MIWLFIGMGVSIILSFVGLILAMIQEKREKDNDKN